MMSPEIQADRYEKLRVIPVLDNEKLSGEQKPPLTGWTWARGQYLRMNFSPTPS